MAKVLLVEDQEDNRDMLSRRLKKRGYEVEIAVDGAEGVEKARSEAPDLILMDMSLPVMDGWEATRTLKDDEDDARSIPVVALTAHAMSTDREKALEAGCDAYETKPVELPQACWSTMEKLLQTRVLQELSSPPAPDAQSGGSRAQTDQVCAPPTPSNAMCDPSRLLALCARQLVLAVYLVDPNQVAHGLGGLRSQIQTSPLSARATRSSSARASGSPTAL